VTYTIVDRVASADEHRALSASVGWQDHIEDAVLDASLGASVRGAVALHNGTVVGMARLIGDGAHYFYVQDVIVHPDHEGEGLASQLTSRLLDWVDNVTAAPAFVGLFSSPDARGVYESLGFTTDDMTGMHRGV
jgi:GNAT superfamily N-acetyltransferase